MTQPQLTIELPGDPIAQGRHRMDTRGRRPRAFDPPKSKAYKDRVADIALVALKRARLPVPLHPDAPVRLTIVMRFRCPKPHRVGVPWPERWHTKKPDASNVTKAIEDGLNGLGYTDDGQVSHLDVIKLVAPQGEPAGVTVTLTELPPR